MDLYKIVQIYFISLADSLDGGAWNDVSPWGCKRSDMTEYLSPLADFNNFYNDTMVK